MALKYYVHTQIPLLSLSSPVYPYDGIALFRNWQGIDGVIVHVINKGAAWGILASLQEYLLYLRVAILGGLITYLCFVKMSSYRMWSLLLVTAGAFGNILDVFFYGHVVDMFYFTFWGYAYPVFNLADSAIFVGIVLLMAEGLWKRWAPSKQKKPA